MRKLTSELGNLEGVQFIRSGWLETPERWENGSPVLQPLREAERDIAEIVKDHGGTIVSSLDEIEPERPWYRLDLDYDNHLSTIDELLDAHHDRLPLLSKKMLDSLTPADVATLFEQLAARQPCVFAYNRYARGHGKYLIEHEFQLERILQLVADNPSMDFAKRCEIRPFIDTPSEHDTTLRIDVAATGKLVAAALISSGHTKASRPSIIRDRWNDLLQEDSEIRFLKTQFEDPDSPYFLNALSPRSNISSGGDLIPLMGPGKTTKLTSQQEHILEAHNIDPIERGVPEDVSESAHFAGATFGRLLHPVLGLDFLPDGTTRQNWLIDINPGPGVKTFTQCWPEQGADLRPNIVRQRLAALATIAPLYKL